MRSLEANGLMHSTARRDGKRMVRYYELTAEGRQRLTALRRELLRVMHDIGLYAELPRAVQRPRLRPAAQSRRRSQVTRGRPALC